MSHEEADKLCNEAINEMKDKGEVYNHLYV